MKVYIVVPFREFFLIEMKILGMQDMIEIYRGISLEPSFPIEKILRIYLLRCLDVTAIIL